MPFSYAALVSFILIMIYWFESVKFYGLTFTNSSIMDAISDVDPLISLSFALDWSFNEEFLFWSEFLLWQFSPFLQFWRFLFKILAMVITNSHMEQYYGRAEKGRINTDMILYPSPLLCLLFQFKCIALYYFLLEFILDILVEPLW